MSLLTRYPLCVPIYKVMPDQSLASQGGMKYGQSGDLFDVPKHLIQIEQDAPSAVIGPQESAKLSPQVAQETLGQGVDDDWPTAKPFSEESTKPGTISVQAVQPDTTYPTLPADEPIPFMMDVRRSQFWRQPRVRAVLTVLALLLLVSLIAQWGYRERHFLSTANPQLAPVLRTICNAFGCQVDALRRIESISIDAASFSKMNDGRYRLSFTMKNSADLPLAVPSIELTLTDLQDRVLVRRTFLANEFDITLQQLAPSSEWVMTVPLELKLDKVAPLIVGYRVWAYYP